MTSYITRFAPSPTGNLHLGSARTALINYIITSKNPNSKFFLRIEDTDKLRSKEKYEINILDGLNWLGIKWQKEVQIQSKRKQRHLEIANSLLINKYAYKCNCSVEKLNEKREEIKKNKLKTKKICTTCKDDKVIQALESNFVIRIKIPEDGVTNIVDKIQGNISINNNEIDDYILIREDGSPTYMISVVVDDHDLNINYIIRGDDHLNNTFRQNFIYKYMQWNNPEYAHLPLINGQDGSKLSKRHGSVNVMELKEKGYLSDAIINNLILLGWSPNAEGDETISMNQIIDKFEISKISKSSSIFNYSKLNFFNNYYLQLSKNFDLFEDYCQSNKSLKKYHNIDKEKLFKIFHVYKKKLNFYDEINDFAYVYFNKNYKFNNKEKFDKKFNEIFKEFTKKLNLIDQWTLENLDKLINNFLIEKNIKFPLFGKPLRFILINSYDGPSIKEIFDILGKKISIDRLNQYIV